MNELQKFYVMKFDLFSFFLSVLKVISIFQIYEFMDFQPKFDVQAYIQLFLE